MFWRFTNSTQGTRAGPPVSGSRVCRVGPPSRRSYYAQPAQSLLGGARTPGTGAAREIPPRPDPIRTPATAMASRSCTFIEILVAIFLPPLGVFLRYGCCRKEFWICVLLTVLGCFPGIVYAVYVLVAVDDRGEHEHCCRGEHCYREEYFAVA
uniref:Uncharacterized protein n=1 Tax=Avena sativa TaxID=4498 RepID=A0ACD5Y262_AVESA